MAGIVYDPNNPDILHRAWEDAVNIGDVAGNGWVFLSENREVLDMVVSDTTDGWVWGEEPTAVPGRNGWDLVAEHARTLGCKDVIYVHHHINSDPIGPCLDVGQFTSDSVIALSNHGIKLRAALICAADRLDGVMQVTEEPIDIMAKRELSLSEGLQLRKMFRDKRDISEADRALAIEALDHALDVIAGIETRNIELLERAAALADSQFNQPKPEPAPKSDPFALPSINVSDIKYMN